MKTHKVCAECKQEHPIEMFCKHTREKDGHDCYCKVCKAGRDKVYRERNKNKISKNKHRYYENNKEVIVEKINTYIDNNRDKHNAWGTKAKNKLKAEVFTHYCCGKPKCLMCGESELGILTIDHINGDGNRHRKEILGQDRGGGNNFYRWLKRSNCPDGFQVLCFNCQYRKRLDDHKPKNPTHRQQLVSKRRWQLKTECLEHYGGCVCNRCGEIELVVLTLDHINNDGAEHRRELGKKANNFYFYLRQDNFPNDPPLQVLCMNCNIRKCNEEYEKRTRQLNEARKNK